MFMRSLGLAEKLLVFPAAEKKGCICFPVCESGNERKERTMQINLEDNGGLQPMRIGGV